jgi:CRISPR-associated exonuclease Cas4
MYHGICIKMSESLPLTRTVPVSSLIRAHRCPRHYYFTKNEPVTVSDRYIICRQVSLADPQNLDGDSLWDEITLIHPAIGPEMREYLDTCISMAARMPFLSWTETDLLIRSEKTGIHGQIDKYDAQAGHVSVVRCTGAPAAGCWPGDRVRMAAYLLCLRETAEIDLAGGYMEYIPDGIVRYYEPGPRDRRALLQALKNIRLVEKGELPGKPVRAPCKNCRYSAQCNPPAANPLSAVLFKKRE